MDADASKLVRLEAVGDVRLHAKQAAGEDLLALTCWERFRLNSFTRCQKVCGETSWAKQTCDLIHSIHACMPLVYHDWTCAGSAADASGKKRGVHPLPQNWRILNDP